MIRRLELKGFKSWREVDLEFGKITGLFGTNSSGKTSLIQFLLMLKQTKDATDRAIALDLNGPLVKLGLYRGVRGARCRGSTKRKGVQLTGMRC